MADQAGYAVTLHNTDKKPEGIIRYIYLLREKSADGIIFSGGIINGQETLSILKELRERVVVIGRHEVDFPAVMVDNIGGAALAVQHLFDIGHRRIGFIGGPDGSTTALDRLTGYKNTMAQNGVTFSPRLVKKGMWTPESGYLLGTELLKGKGRPTAIVAANDPMAFGAIKAAKALGLMVPEDLAVVGFDDIPLSSYFDPPLTTVKLPMHDLGAASMTMLLNLISGEKFEKLRLFKATLQVRESTVKQLKKGKRKKC